MRRAATVALGAACLSTAGAAAQPTFKSGVEFVRVDALVTRDGAPVTGLGAADFEIVDDGVAQTIDHILPAEEPIDLILALDTSGSLDADELAQLTAAARGALASLRPGDRSELIVFSEELHEVASPADPLDRAEAALGRLKASGATSLVDATYTALLAARRLGGRALALVFTDGMDTWSWLEPEWVLDVARRSEAVVYAVGLRDTSEGARIGFAIPGRDYRGRLSPFEFERAATRFLTQVADATGGRRLDAGNTVHLRATLQTVLDEFRQRYVLAYVPRDASSGWHAITVRVKARGVTVRARPGYWR